MNDIKVHDLIQSSPEWHQFRAEHFGASESPAMLGLSKYKTRTELLREKATGIAPEVDAATQSRFDAGHETEAKARVILESKLGEDLYPATYSCGMLSASCDGITMDGSTAFEHKLYNTSLFSSVMNGSLPDEYQPQCQQIMMVTGASRTIFVCSDGTKEKYAELIVYPDQKWVSAISQGWKQFADDLANYQHVEVKAEATGKAPDALPALRIEVTGMVTASNLAEFKAHSLAVFAGINKDLQTDEDFAAAEKTVKWCVDVESRLEAAKEHALSQTQSIDELFKTIDAISAEARRVRLDLDKRVKAQKENRRADIVTKAKAALFNHVSALNTRLGKNYMPVVLSDFPGVIKGKKTITSLQDAADAELARCKILANEIADSIQINLNTLRDMASDYKTLFSDAAAIVLKNNDDLVALVKMRISDHEKELADKKEREQAAIQNMRAQEASEGAKVAPVQEVKPVVAPPVTIDMSAPINHAVIEFNNWFKQAGINIARLHSSQDGLKAACCDAFVNGYNIGKRHGLDEK